MRLRLILLVGVLAACVTAAAPDVGPSPADAFARVPACATRTSWPTAGWATAAAPADYADTALLRRAADTIGTHLTNVRSLLVVRHGVIVYERYFAGATDSTVFDLRSATKSLTSALVGVAVGRGAIRSVTQRLPAFIPEYFANNPDVDPRKRDITLRHLLSMESGLDWDETRAPPFRPGADPVVEILGRPMRERPGVSFNYSSGNSHLLSAAAGRATGRVGLTLANEALFEPMGMPLERLRWFTDPYGRLSGGAGLHLRAREMAKFGWLYLNSGCWEGRQLLPAEWVRESVRRWSTTPGGGAYGYQWWLGTSGGQPIFWALGYGGQFIFVVPGLDAVVVMTAEVRGVPVDAGHGRLMGALIVPALEGRR
ncbi:MAG TPA: serine hydrolase [Gemmatimonadaceae bacterium]|nr:serine hydrolase [Gemmatimonadaceae bacterium]